MNQRDHLLVLLMEECAEVQQRASKALRFGLTEVQPGQELTNAERIAEELSDLRAIVQMLEVLHGLPWSGSVFAINAKVEKVTRYMAYSESCGMLETEDRK